MVLLLLEKGKDGTYQAIDYDSSSNKSELDNIFKDLLLKYQWPMITIYFHELPVEEKNNYLKSLEQENGTLNFINDKLRITYKDQYKVIFVPSTIFELAAINSFAEDVISSKTQPSGEENHKSIFPTTDLRNGVSCGQFPRELEDKILEGLKLNPKGENAAFKAVKHAFEPYNLNLGVKELYFHTAKYLIDRHTLKSLEELNEKDKSIETLLERLLTHFLQIKPDFLVNLSRKEQDLYQNFNLWETKRNHPYFIMDDLPILKNGALAEFKAAKENQFLLFRGTGGFRLSKEQDASLSNKQKGRGDQTLIDTPYREILKDYEETSKNGPSSFKAILPIQPTEKPEEWDGSEKDTFTPTSLSYGNSLLAGTFYETSDEGGARSLDYMRKSWGYSLVFSIKDYLAPSGKGILLHQKYFISPLYSITALFAQGELFHSRSKISLAMMKKKWSKGYVGIQTAAGKVRELLLEDQGNLIGFLISPNIDWGKLSSDITLDIARHIAWVKDLEVKDRELLLDTQKNVSYFTALEIDAFKEHFAKFQPVLSQIKEGLALRHVEDRKEGTVKSPLEEFSKGNKSERSIEEREKVSLAFSKRITNPFQRTLTLTIPLDIRFYNKENLFWKIIQDPEAVLKTPLHLNTTYSLAFDDLKKRTKEHILVIPKGQYISLPHFADFASSTEIVDFFRAIATTAEKRGLEKEGYRIISNHALKPGSDKNNNAYQEIPHFHVHLAGGECLGQPVAGASFQDISHSSVDMDVSTPPYGFGLSEEQFLQNAFANKLAEITFILPSKEVRRLVAYRIPFPEEKLPDYIGFVLLDQKGKTVYKSIHDFSKNASAEELTNTVKFISNVAKSIGIYTSGFRLIAGHGNDAWHFPQGVMQISIAGGNLLGVTVTNAWGNRLRSPNTGWMPGAADYADLSDMHHDHCPAHPGDYNSFIEGISDKFDLDTENPERFKKFRELSDRFIDYSKNIETLKIKLQEQVPGTIAHCYLKNSIKTFEAYKVHNTNIEAALTEVEPIIRQGSKTIEEARSVKKKFDELYNSKNILDAYLKGTLKRQKNSQEFERISNLKFSLPSSWEKTFDKWIFINLDGTLTKGTYSTTPTENGLINNLKQLIQNGYKIIALTNRHYWEKMGSSSSDPSHKDTFDLLKTLDLEFSNPENIAPFDLDAEGDDINHRPRFKNGVIFCADSPHGIGWGLEKYLEALAKKNGEFPQEIYFYDTKAKNVDAVLETLEKLEIPGKAYYYRTN